MVKHSPNVCGWPRVPFPVPQEKPLNLAWVSSVFRGSPSLRIWSATPWPHGPVAHAEWPWCPLLFHTYFTRLTVLFLKSKPFCSFCLDCP